MNAAARYRLLACDVDDTLLRFPDPPSPCVSEAIRAASQAGVQVVLVTGRAFRRARPVAQALGLETPLICNHGGSIRDTGDGSTLYRATMPRARVLEVVSWLQTQSLCLFLFDGDRVYHDCQTDEVVPDFQVYTRGELSTFVRDLRTAVPEESEIVLSSSRSHQHLAEVFEQARDRWGASLRVLFSHPFGMDVMPPSSKSQALAWLAAHLGVRQEEVMAAGDGGNDVDMLAWAGLGVAMGDGSPEARAAADVVAPSFAEDGLAWAIEQYILRAEQST